MAPKEFRAKITTAALCGTYFVQQNGIIALQLPPDVNNSEAFAFLPLVYPCAPDTYLPPPHEYFIFYLGVCRGVRSRRQRSRNHKRVLPLQFAFIVKFCLSCVWNEGTYELVAVNVAQVQIFTFKKILQKYI